MAVYKIYHKNGSVLADTNGKEIEVHSIEYNGTWMGECFVTVTFENEAPIDFSIGDYIVYRNERFEINYDPGKIKCSSKDSYGGAFKYDSVKFNALSDELVRCDMLDLVLYDNNLHYTALPQFAFYVESLDDLLDRIQANLDDFYGKATWKLYSRNKERSIQRGCTAEGWESAYGAGTTDNVIDSTSISISDQNCWDALSLVNSKFDVNFIIRDRNVYVGTAGVPTANIFKYGKDKGLYEIEQNSESDQAIVTRLRAYGSNRNLPNHYYADLGSIPFLNITGDYHDGSTDSGLSVMMEDSVYAGMFTDIISDNGSNIKHCRIRGSIDGYEFDGNVELVKKDSTKSTTRLLVEGKAVCDAIKAKIDAGIVQVDFISGANKTKFNGNRINYVSNLPNNMACDRLMLPGFPNKSLSEWWNEQSEAKKAWLNPGGKGHDFSVNRHRPYVDSLNIDSIGVRPASVFFDQDDKVNGIVEIYPTIEEMEVDGVRIDEIYTGTDIEDDGRFGDGETVANVPIYLSPKVNFDIRALMQEDFTIHMKDGMCAGREFKVAGCTKEKDGSWKLMIERNPDSSLDLYFPYNDFQIKKGDHFVLTGIELPDAYVEAASEKLLKYCIAYLDKNDYTRYVYHPKVDEIFMARQHDTAVADSTGLTRSLYMTLKEGDIMLFKDDDLGIDAEITIDQLIIKEEDGKIPTYEITLREEKEVGTIQKIQNQISSIVSGNGGAGTVGGGVSTTQIKNLIDSVGSDRFLSKINPDTAAGVITFLRGLISKAKSIFKEGIEIGNFVTGWLGGSGAAIDKDGNAEFESIKARGFIETPELRFNRIDVVSGELWNSVCFGTIERVDTDRRLVWLKLEDGELSGIHVNDICRGIFHSINGNNPIKERLDECNFIELAGFATSYFTPTVVYDNGASFKYSLKPGTTVHPQVGMKFAVYGNFTDKSRQASAYQTRTYQRYLNKVDTWVIDPGKNIYMQLGLLDGLTISGYQLKDYGALMHNVYLSGVHIDFDRDFLESITPDVYAMHLTRSNFIVITDLEGNIIDGLKETDNVTANDDGEAANVTANTVGGDDFDNVTVGNVYLMRSTIQAYNGDTQLLYSDHIEEGMFVAELDAHGCKAVADNGIVTITDIDTSAESIYVDVRINCEGNVHLTKRIDISVIVEPENGVTADLDNEMTSLPSDDKGNVFAFSPVKVVPRLWYGNDPMVITRAYVEKLPDGITTNVQLVTESGYSYYDIPFVDGVRTLIISGVSKSAADVNELLICVEGKINSRATNTYTKSTVFKLNKVKMGENAIRYELVPSTNEIIVDKDGNVKTSAVSCQVIELDGKGTATLTTSAQLSARNLTMKVCIYNASATGSEVGYSIGSNVSIGSTYGGQAFTKDTLKAVFTLYHNGTLIDKEGVPVIRNGVYSVRLDLDNENDSMLYNGNGVLISGSVVSHATLFDGVTNVNSAVTEWSMQGSTGCNASVSNNTITVTAMSANTGSVTIGAKYLGNIYTAQLTLKKLVGVDKYEIVATPTSVTRDPNTGKYSHTSITVDVYVTRQNGTREKNPNMGGATLSNNITGGMTPGEAFPTSKFGDNNKQVVFTVTRNGAVEDSETVPLLEAGLNGKKRVVIQPVGGGTRSYTYAQWNSWGAYGHSENWGCSNVNEIVVGDTGVIAGYVSDRGNISATIEGIVTSKGTDTVAMTSLVLTMKGDNGKDAEYNVIEVLSNTVKVGLTGMASGVLSYKVCHIKGSTKTDIQADANFKFIFTGEEHGGKYSGATATFTFDNHKLDPSYITLRYGNTSMVVQPASDGDSYFIINRGVLKTPNTYKYKRNSTTGIWERDYGVYQIGEASYYFMVKNKDTEVTAMPTKAEDDDNWQLMSKYQAVLADTLIGNNCNIGGFLASDEYFVSDSKVTNPKSDSIYDRHNIVLDGKNGKVVANDCKIRGEVNATSGTFENCKITNNCSIEPKNKGGGGWFLRGGKDSDGVDKGAAAWWLGYEGSMPGQFTMENEYGESGYIPAYVRLSFKTPRITSTGSDGGDVIQVYSNISHPLATFSHTYGTTVNICPSEGTGIEFLQSSAAKTPIAFKGTGHGVLNGVIQGYKLNVMTSGLIKISEGNTVYCNGVSTTLALPKLSDCRNVLGTAGAFALDLTIIAASGASNFRVEGSDYSTLTDCKLVSNNHAAWYATMSQGDVLQLKLISNDSTFYAYIVSHIN